MAKPNAPEARTIDVDVSDLSTTGKTIVGYAAVYNRESRDLGGFRERIAPGAFDSVLADADVRCLLNHDPNIVLGRTASGTLRLASEERGLRFECDLPESRADLRESVSRGDLDGASFRFEVGKDSWSGDLRTVESVKTLHDVSLASYPAYPSASVELRTDPRASSNREDDAGGGGLVVRDRASLRVTDRNGGDARSLMAEFRSRGFPSERATMPFGEFRALTLDSGTTAVNVSPTRQQGVPFGFDQRYAYPVLPQVGVDAGTTAVETITQSDRTLADDADTVRDIDEVTDKPETGSEIDVGATPLKQVASVQTGIPNVYLENDLVASVVENDLRLAVNEGLDSLVLAAVATSGFQAPGSDKLLVSIRKAMTTIAAAGYNPDTLILSPTSAEALDVTVSASGTEDYIFGPGSPASGVWSLNRRVSKGVPAPIVMDSSAFGRFYTSPISLQRFEENAGQTNTSLVRLELHALCGAERTAAAVRIAAS